MDKNGDIYVTDSYNSRIQKFSPEGDFLAKWSANVAGYGEVFESEPYGIVVDENGIVYVTDSRNHSIKKFSPEGNFLTMWGSYSSKEGYFGMPYGCVIGDNGNIYIADRDNHRIQVFDPDGKFATAWGSKGSGDGEFEFPCGMAIGANDNIYVADRDNNRIQVFDQAGTPVNKWGRSGSGDGQFNTPVGIAVDKSGNVYVVDRDNNRIQKFDSNGEYITQWGDEGSENGQFYSPLGVAIGDNNNIYVADTANHRIQIFDDKGVFIAKWGNRGSGEGEFNYPFDISTDEKGDVFVCDYLNNRIQKFNSKGEFLFEFGEFGLAPGHLYYPSWITFDSEGRLYISEVVTNSINIFQRVSLTPNNKAIILAGGKKNDILGDEIRSNANYAYRALIHQGFSNEDIIYLNSNSNLDTVDGEATTENLRNAITNWETVPDSLVLYLVDHGGDGMFRMNDTEILNSDDLNSWLDTLQENMNGSVILVYDACRSGSFLSDLSSTDYNRILITSASYDESAYFTSQGENSFSNYFWSNIFKGENLKDTFENTKTSLSDDVTGFYFQTPLIYINRIGICSHPEDTECIKDIYIGNGTKYSEDETYIERISANIIPDTTTGEVHAYGVTDDDGISRVWAVIKPPDINLPANATVLDLPTIELLPEQENLYKGSYENFTQEQDPYYIAVYVTDMKGNTTAPMITMVSANNLLRHKAILVAGHSRSDDEWAAIENNVSIAHKALTMQGFDPINDIKFLSYLGFLPGTSAEDANLANLESAITGWAKDALDVVIYLAGSSSGGKYEIKEGEKLDPIEFNQWLNKLQENLPGRVTVVMDFASSGGYIQALIPKNGERIVISSTSESQPSSFIFHTDVSLSNFFWNQVMKGVNVLDAFWLAKNTIEFFSPSQQAVLDDNGNGIGNEISDGQSARHYTIGMGIRIVTDEPVAGDISPEQILKNGETSADITVDVVTSGSIIGKVWGVVIPPGTDIGQIHNQTFALDPLEDGRYKGTYSEFNSFGIYHIVIYATDDKGNISILDDTTVYQPAGPDSYEIDNDFTQANTITVDAEFPQHHNFHYEEDVDWVKFNGESNETYKIVARNVGVDCDVVIELYDTDGTNLLKEMNTIGDPHAYEILYWPCPRDGDYYVKIKNIGVFGEDTKYDFEIIIPAVEEGVIDGFIKKACTNELIGNAKIEIDSKFCSEEDSKPELGCIFEKDKGYFQIQMSSEGTFDLIAEADGYEKYINSVKVKIDEVVIINIYMIPTPLTLANAVSVLQIMGGIENDQKSVCKEMDMSKNNHIGTEEAIYILQKLSELR